MGEFRDILVVLKMKRQAIPPGWGQGVWGGDAEDDYRCVTRNLLACILIYLYFPGCS